MGHSVPQSYCASYRLVSQAFSSGMECRGVWKRDSPRRCRGGRKKKPFIPIFFREKEKKEKEKKRGTKRERKNSLSLLSPPFSAPRLAHIPQKKEWLPDSLCRSFFFYFSLSPCSVRGKTSFDESFCMRSRVPRLFISFTGENTLGTLFPYGSS